MKLIIKLVLVAIQSLFILGVHANAKVSFCNDILPLIETKCYHCHQEGGIGPFAMNNYNQIADKIHTIRAVTLSGVMPPWPANPHKSLKFNNENYLTESEKQIIYTWMQEGLEGENSNCNLKLKTSSTSSIEKPDTTILFCDLINHEGNGKDKYYVVKQKLNLSKDLYIRKIRINSSELGMIHHALFATKDSKEVESPNTAKNQGWTKKLFAKLGNYFNKLQPFKNKEIDFLGSDSNLNYLFCYTPGNYEITYADDTYVLVKEGEDIIAQLHLAPSHLSLTVDFSVDIWYGDGDSNSKQLNSLFTGKKDLIQLGMKLPADRVTSYCTSLKFEKDICLTNLFPHAHNLAKTVEISLITNKNDTTRLLKIDEWDFDWQFYYDLLDPLEVASGSTIIQEVVYDNTKNNPRNPNFPPKEVKWGSRTVDEMNILGVCYYYP